MFKRIKLRIIKGRQLLPFEVAKVLQEHEDKLTAIAGTDTTELADIGALKTTVGNADSGLVKDVNTLKSASATYVPVEVVVTYTDDSTETKTLLSVVEPVTEEEEQQSNGG